MLLTAKCTESNGSAVFPFTSRLVHASKSQPVDCNEVLTENLERLTGLEFVRPHTKFNTQGLMSIEVGDFVEDVDRGQVWSEKKLRVVLHPRDNHYLKEVDRKLIKPEDKLQPNQLQERGEVLKDLKFLIFTRLNGNEVSQLIVTCRLDFRKKEFTVICVLDLPTDENVIVQENLILLSAYAEKVVSQQVHEPNGRDKDVDPRRRDLTARARILQKSTSTVKEENDRFLKLLSDLEESVLPNETDIEVGYFASVEIIYDATRDRIIRWCEENNHQLASDFGRNPTLITNENREELCMWAMADESRHHKFSHGLGANPNIVSAENIDELVEFAKNDPYHQFSQGLARNTALLNAEFKRRESLVRWAENQLGTGNEKHRFARSILAMNTLLEKQATQEPSSEALGKSKQQASDGKVEKDDPDVIKRITYLERHPAATLKERERGHFQNAKIATNELRGRICTWLIDNYNSDYAFEFGCNEGLLQGEFRDFLVNLVVQEDDNTYRTSNLGEALGGNPEIITDDNLTRLITCVQRYPDDRFSVAFGNNTELLARIRTCLKAHQSDPCYVDGNIGDLVEWAQLNENNRFAQAVLALVKEHELSVRKEAKSFGNKTGPPPVNGSAEGSEAQQATQTGFKRSTTSGEMSLSEVVRKVVEREAFSSRELTWFCLECSSKPSEDERTKMQTAIKEEVYSNTAIAQYLGWKYDFLITSSNVLNELKWAKQRGEHNYAIGIALNPNLFNLLGGEETQKLINWAFENPGSTFSSTIQRRVLEGGLVEDIVDKAIHEGRPIPKRILESIDLNNKKVREHILQLAMEGNETNTVAYSIGYKFGVGDVRTSDVEMDELQRWCEEHDNHDLSKGFKRGAGVRDAELQRQQGVALRAQTAGVTPHRGKQGVLDTLQSPEAARTIAIDCRRRAGIIRSAMRQRFESSSIVFYLGQNVNLLTPQFVERIIPWAWNNPDNKFAEGFGLNEKLKDTRVLSHTEKERLVTRAKRDKKSAFARSVLKLFGVSA